MTVTKGDFKEFGPRIKGENDVVFTFTASPSAKNISLLLFDNKSKEQLSEIQLSKEFSIGLVYSVRVLDLNPNDICYLICQDGKTSLDPYASLVYGRDDYNDCKNRASSGFLCYGGIADLDPDFEDNSVKIQPRDMIMYKLHMRGFTFGSGLSDKKAGNYTGIISKLPYIKSLGITSIEIMPIYDFEEIGLENKMTIGSKGHRKNSVVPSGKVNYWGYGIANYFAPKASYFLGAGNAANGLRELVSAIHDKGMELIMEMSFAKDVSADLIMDCLKYYVRYYHIDGFHILGPNGPVNRLVLDPILSDTKIFYEFIPEETLITQEYGKHIFIYNDSFMEVGRQLENHMNGSMVQFANHMRRQNGKYGFVNYMDNVNGFCLWDSYSYGEKHNLANGEENRDGNNNNYSFNYGCEGKSGKKSVNINRFREMRNAFAIIMLSQAIPLFVAADECAASHMGNNNPYCQDNPIGYTCFSKSKNKNILTKFVKELINFRKEHGCLRPEQPFTMNDSKHLGLPDMSFHGSEPWMMTIGEEQKALGVLYSGAYAKENTDVYVCYNFHYNEVNMALPLLSPGKRWRLCFNTANYDENSDFEPKAIDNQQSINVPGSSISVLIGMKVGQDRK
ncbi:MAG: hypothetical protein K5773_02575 [Pseudobutyrivibrio sp.]|nr:hypothetical protein [Pseudobutyrivibrio sp.]